jgi:hypothetical protein
MMHDRNINIFTILSPIALSPVITTGFCIQPVVPSIFNPNTYAFERHANANNYRRTLHSWIMLQRESVSVSSGHYGSFQSQGLKVRTSMPSHANSMKFCCAFDRQDATIWQTPKIRRSPRVFSPQRNMIKHMKSTRTLLHGLASCRGFQAGLCVKSSSIVDENRSSSALSTFAVLAIASTLLALAGCSAAAYAAGAASAAEGGQQLQQQPHLNLLTSALSGKRSRRRFHRLRFRVQSAPSHKFLALV